MEVDYSDTESIAKDEKKGRIIMSVILFTKMLYSGFIEWARSNVYKPKLLDPRQSFKIYGILRYLFLLIVIPASLLTLYYYSSLSLVLVLVVSGVQCAEELIIILMIIFKICSIKQPSNLKYIEEDKKTKESIEAVKN